MFNLEWTLLEHDIELFDDKLLKCKHQEVVADKALSIVCIRE